MEYEYAVMFPRQWGDQDPHRTFDTRDKAYQWIAESIAECNFRTDVFYVARRPKGWERDGV